MGNSQTHTNDRTNRGQLRRLPADCARLPRIKSEPPEPGETDPCGLLFQPGKFGMDLRQSSGSTLAYKTIFAYTHTHTHTHTLWWRLACHRPALTGSDIAETDSPRSFACESGTNHRH